MKIVESMVPMNPQVVGVVCDWCGDISLGDEPQRPTKAAFSTTKLIGSDGSQIDADICGGCADQRERRPNAVLGRLVHDASCADTKDYRVYRYAAFDIDSDQIVRVQSLVPLCKPA